MHPTDLSAEASAKAEANLSPDERRREIATIFAAGILRLTTRPEAMPERADSAAQDGTEEVSDSGQKPLDSGCGTSPHVPAG
jgi:hypothetical protein